MTQLKSQKQCKAPSQFSVEIRINENTMGKELITVNTHIGLVKNHGGQPSPFHFLTSVEKQQLEIKEAENTVRKNCR